jgi:hypothetical protein
MLITLVVDAIEWNRWIKVYVGRDVLRPELT